METPVCPGCRERDARIAALEAEVARLAPLEREVAALKAQVQELLQKLHDLTRPPTPPRAPADLGKAPAKKPTGRKPGGQPGHPPHLKQLLPPERVNHLVTYVPEHCEHCQSALPPEAGPNDPPPVRHQVAELPELTAHITEHQGHARVCSCCGKVTRAGIPPEIRAHSVGPRLTGVMSYFVGCHGVSKRGTEEIAEAWGPSPTWNRK
jgi:transposase